MSKKSITTTGCWTRTGTENHYFDPCLCKIIGALFAGQSVIDLGCGLGDYVKYYRHLCKNIEGYDGNPHTEELSEGLCKTADLSKKQAFGKFDWVLSLEVGEHIPQCHESTFVYNLCSHATKGVVLSWAVPGQPGFGHVNCRENKDVVAMMREYDFVYDFASSLILRTFATAPWFKNTVMIFHK